MLGAASMTSEHISVHVLYSRLFISAHNTKLHCYEVFHINFVCGTGVHVYILALLHIGMWCMLG